MGKPLLDVFVFKWLLGGMGKPQLEFSYSSDYEVEWVKSRIHDYEVGWTNHS